MQHYVNKNWKWHCFKRNCGNEENSIGIPRITWPFLKTNFQVTTLGLAQLSEKSWICQWMEENRSRMGIRKQNYSKFISIFRGCTTFRAILESVCREVNKRMNQEFRLVLMENTMIYQSVLTSSVSGGLVRVLGVMWSLHLIISQSFSSLTLRRDFIC